MRTPKMRPNMSEVAREMLKEGKKSSEIFDTLMQWSKNKKSVRATISRAIRNYPRTLELTLPSLLHRALVKEAQERGVRRQTMALNIIKEYYGMK